MNGIENDYKPLMLLCLILATLGGCLSDEEIVSTEVDPPPTNSPPTISGTPISSVTISDNYSFTPTASDPDGDPLTFSVSNLPVWASFDNTTGTLSGTPQLGDIGTYNSVSISVSDSIASASMTPFEIMVNQFDTFAVTLSWTAPTLYEDGSPLNDLAGYTIHYGRQSGNYTSTINVDNPSVTTYVVDNLSSGAYFFAAKSFNVNGVESDFSNEATKVAQ